VVETDVDVLVGGADYGSTDKQVKPRSRIEAFGLADLPRKHETRRRFYFVIS